MPKPHSRRIDSDDPLLRGKQAKQIADLLDHFIQEFQYMEDMLQFFSHVAVRQYPTHRRLVAALRHEDGRLNHAVRDLMRLRKEYLQVVGDEEHKFGVIDTPSLLPMFNYTISILDLLDLFPMDRVVEDFLDG